MSEETDNILPAIPTGEDIERQREQQKLDEVRQYLLDARENYPEPYYMLEYNGVPFSTIGGIQALSGQKKNGKTFVLAQLMAAILADENSRAEEYLSGLRIPKRTVDWLGHKPSVLYVDTEMEKLNSAKVLRRVHWLCNWDMDVPNERFHVLWLRGVTDVKDETGEVKERAYSKRYRLIKAAIDILHPDAVFIDGIRDIIGDFNDNSASAALVGDLMALAEQKQICIWNTLHMNPRPGNDDESKMRGHLGTELGNKITDTLVSIKKKDSTGVTFTVKQNDARGKDMEDWKFEVTGSAGSLGIPRIIPSNTADAAVMRSEDKEEQIINDTVLALKDIILAPKCEYISKIFDKLRESMNMGEQRVKKYFTAVRNKYPTLIYQRSDKKWTMSQVEFNNFENELPF